MYELVYFCLTEIDNSCQNVLKPIRGRNIIHQLYKIKKTFCQKIIINDLSDVVNKHRMCHVPRFLFLKRKKKIVFVLFSSHCNQ